MANTLKYTAADDGRVRVTVASEAERDLSATADAREAIQGIADAVGLGAVTFANDPVEPAPDDGGGDTPTPDDGGTDVPPEDPAQPA